MRHTPLSKKISRATTPAVPMAFVRGILLAYDRYGVDPGSALEKAQIRPEATREISGRATSEQFEDLSWVAMQELDDEAVGWFSRKLPWGAYGMLCRASIGSASLGLALRRWSRHHRILTEDVLLELDVTGGSATIGIQEYRDLSDFREICLVTLLRYILGFACWAIDERIPLTMAEFPYSPPPHADIYSKLFSPDLRFEAKRACIRFDADYLARPLQRDETALNMMLKRALPLTVLPYRRDRHLTSQVLRILRMSKASFPVAEDVAQAFNLSVRTLHRQLSSEGTSLRQLKERTRIERAKEALTRSTQSIQRVAYVAGFRNEKSFSRAFRTWTGETPSGYRNSVGLISRDPLRVIAEVTHWEGHSPERLQQMRDNVARAKAEGTNIID